MGRMDDIVLKSDEKQMKKDKKMEIPIISLSLMYVPSRVSVLVGRCDITDRGSS